MPDKYIKYLRVEEWMTSKVTMMMGILVFFFYVNNDDIYRSGLSLLVYFLFVSMFLAVSYVVNDLSDIEADKIAGKVKVIADMPLKKVLASLIAMIAAGNVPLVIFASNKPICILMIILTYILGLAYSTLGIRFKEKGLDGLIECSFAQRCMPLFLIPFLEKIDAVNLIYLILWILLSFFDGLRYILIHQIIDRKNDEKSGIHTFVIDREKNYRNIVLALFLLEMILCVCVLFPVWIKHPIIFIIAVCGNFFLEYCIYMVLCVYAGKDWMVTFDSVPLEAFLNIFMPILNGICMSYKSPAAIIFCLLILAVCSKALKIKMDIAYMYIKSK